MMEIDFRNVSPHCLNNLVNASESSGLHTTENIFDTSGLKLLTSGYRLNKNIVERLLNRKLQKPLETSLRTENGLRPDEISKDAIELLALFPVLNQFSGNIEEDCKQLKFVSIEPVAEILLTAYRDNNRESYQHELLVMILSRLLGRELKLQSHEMRTLTMSAQVHDLGELYIDPDCFIKNISLSSKQLKNVSAHPEIIKILLLHHTQYPKEVSRAVLEHHERADGTGYPKSLIENQLSLNGQILIVAEVLSVMILQPNFNLYKALLAFKLLPNEFPKRVIEALHQIAKRAHVEFPSQQSNPINLSYTQPIIARLTNIQGTLSAHIKSNVLTANEKSIAEAAHHYLVHLGRDLIATGLDYYLEEKAWQTLQDDPVLQVEVEVIANETIRRMKDISRKMTLHFSTHNESPSPAMQTVIDEMLGLEIDRRVSH